MSIEDKNQFVADTINANLSKDELLLYAIVGLNLSATLANDKKADLKLKKIVYELIQKGISFEEVIGLL
jgi:hypothetical protein